jgi:hypothetical protein
MTATTKPPKRRDPGRTRPVRFFSMESLGFSDARSTWSDSPLPIPMELQAIPEPQPSHLDPLEDWKPEEFAPRLDGRNVRWSVLITIALLIGGALGLAYWLYQRPADDGGVSVEALSDEVDGLLAALPGLEKLSQALVADPTGVENIDITGVETAARQLFEAGGELSQDETETRYLTTGAAGSALDGVRLAGDARAYLLAVTPILNTPDLETDPSLIALDDAARSFGDWELRFDDVRTALPDGVLSDVTEQLDVVSGDLTSILSDYIDALREDDQKTATDVVEGLSSRLADVQTGLAAAMGETQELVNQRIDETRSALATLQGD